MHPYDIKRICQTSHINMTHITGTPAFAIFKWDINALRLLTTWRLTCLWMDSQAKDPQIATFKIHNTIHISRVSCQKGPTHHAYAWQIGPFWQDTLDMENWFV